MSDVVSPEVIHRTGEDGFGVGLVEVDEGGVRNLLEFLDLHSR